MPNLLDVETESKLVEELTELYYQKPFLSWKEIVQKLQLGVSGTKYEQLKPRHAKFYHRKHHLPARHKELSINENLKKPRIAKKPAIIKKKIIPRRNKTSKSPLKWNQVNPLQLDSLWKKFNGTFSEFTRYVERNFAFQ